MARARWFEPLHAPFPLAGRLGGIFGAIVQMVRLPMFHTREDLPLGGTIAAELVRDDDPRHGRQSLEEFTQELLDSFLVSPALHQDIEHMALVIDGPPLIVTFAADGIDEPEWLRRFGQPLTRSAAA